MHIAYFQNWGLGDLVMTLPALAELRRLYPNAKLSLVVRGGAQKAFLQDNPLVDQILSMPPRSNKLALARFFLGLRREKIDVAFIGTRISPSLPLLIRALSGVRTIVGDGRKMRGLYSHLVPFVDGRHRVEQMRAAVAQYSGEDLGPVSFPLYLSEGAREEADRYLSSKGLDRGSYVVIHAGSSVSAGTDKRLPGSLVRELVDGLRKSVPHAKVALLFGPDEMELVDRYAPYGQDCVAITGTSLPVTQSILAGSRVFVGTDSAPGHLAAAFGVPTFTVVGPTKPLETAPWGPLATVVSREEPYACQPCWGTPRYGNCPYGVRCMTGLPVAFLVDHVRAGFERE